MAECPVHARQRDLVSRVNELSISVTVTDLGDGSCSVVHVAGEADLATTPSLGDVLTAEASKKPGLLLVDLSALQFIDSCSIRMVLFAAREVRQYGGTLALINPSSVVARVVQIMGVDQLIPVHDSVDEAIARVD
jgi:anti-sigma B factor antagonist